MSDQVHINQIDLVAKIGKWIAKEYKVKGVVPRQYNAIIAAANLIVEAFAIPFIEAPPGCGWVDWYQSDESGQSSKYMGGILRGFSRGVEFAHPHDPDDFRRCVVLLKACPELRPNLPRLKECPHPWPALADNWSELEALFEEESPTKKCPKLYARMKELIESKTIPRGPIDAEENAGGKGDELDRGGHAGEAPDVPPAGGSGGTGENAG